MRRINPGCGKGFATVPRSQRSRCQLNKASECPAAGAENGRNAPLRRRVISTCGYVERARKRHEQNCFLRDLVGAHNVPHSVFTTRLSLHCPPRPSHIHHIQLPPFPHTHFHYGRNVKITLVYENQLCFLKKIMDCRSFSDVQYSYRLLSYQIGFCFKGLAII